MDRNVRNATKLCVKVGGFCRRHGSKLHFFDDTRDRNMKNLPMTKWPENGCKFWAMLSSKVWAMLSSKVWAMLSSKSWAMLSSSNVEAWINNVEQRRSMDAYPRWDSSFHPDLASSSPVLGPFFSQSRSVQIWTDLDWEKKGPNTGEELARSGWKLESQRGYASMLRRCSTLFIHASTLLDDNMAQLFDDNMAQTFDDNMAQTFDDNMAQNLHPFSGHFVIGKFFIFRSLVSSKKCNFDPCLRQNPPTLTHNFVAFLTFRSIMSSKK